MVIAIKSKAQTPTTYWDNNGVPYKWFIQTDVVSFKTNTGSFYTGTLNYSVVDHFEYHPERRDSATEIYFKPTATIPQRLAEVVNIYSSGQVGMPYVNISSDSNKNFSDTKWYTIDNLILVTFKTPYPTQSYLDAFKLAYDLELYYVSDSATMPQLLPTDYSYCHIFRARANSSMMSNPDYFPSLVRTIQSSNLNNNVKFASPNIVNAYTFKNNITDGGNPEPPALKDYQLCDESNNDPWTDDQWYIDNDGYNNIHGNGGCPNGVPNVIGTIGADAKICDCWDLLNPVTNNNLTGAGISVGVLSQGDVYVKHEDLMNQTYARKWDCSGTAAACVPLVSALNNCNHSMHIQGIIAATKNNSKGIAGIAPGVELVPIKVGVYNSNTGITTTSVAEVIKGVDKALELNVYILVIDFVSLVEDLSLQAALFKHHIGRYGIGETGLGTIIISSTGHTETTGVTNPNGVIPAGFNLDDGVLKVPEVIGVISTNRFDKSCTGEGQCQAYNFTTPNVNTNWEHPSNTFGANDIGVPSVGFYSTYNQTNIYRELSGDLTQDQNAMGVAAGVVALLLEFKPFLTDLDVRQRLRNNADKVSYTYTSGFSTKMAFGRINCINTLLAENNFPEALSAMASLNKLIVVNLPNAWNIKMASNETNTDFNYKIYNNLGQLIKTSKFNNILNKEFTIDNAALPIGTYYIEIANLKNNIRYAEKIYK
jgi:Subtilase family